MKTPILVAVRLKGQRGRKEYAHTEPGKVTAGFETWCLNRWPPKEEDKAFRRWSGFDGDGWDNGPR